MTDIKYLEVVAVKDELPTPGSTTVAFVPGQGFQGALYHGPGTSPQWRSTITHLAIEPTHWCKPFTTLDLVMRAHHAKDLEQWTKEAEALLNHPELKEKSRNAFNDLLMYGEAKVDLLPMNILNADTNLFWPEEGYRVPKLEEFVQGFEFEVVDWLQPTGWIIPDGKKLRHIPFDQKTVWKPMKVTWMCDPNEDLTYQHGDYTVHTKGSFSNFFKPFNVEGFLKQGLIRVKITNP